MSDLHNQKKAGLGFPLDNDTMLPCGEGGSWQRCEDKSPAALHGTSTYPASLPCTLPTALLSTSVCVSSVSCSPSHPPPNPALREKMHARLVSPAPHLSHQFRAISCFKIIPASGVIGSQHWTVMARPRVSLKEFGASVEWVSKIMASCFPKTFSRLPTVARKWGQMKRQLESPGGLNLCLLIN